MSLRKIVDHQRLGVDKYDVALLERHKRVFENVVKDGFFKENDKLAISAIVRLQTPQLVGWIPWENGTNARFNINDRIVEGELLSQFTSWLLSEGFKFDGNYINIFLI